MITFSSRTVRLRAEWTGYLKALPRAFAAAATFGGLIATVCGPAEAKTPGETYCYYGTCHRVMSLAETEARVGTEETLPSSFYDSCKHDPLNPCGLTSSGEAFDPDAADNAASPIYPDGTTLLIWSPESRAAAVIRVNNAGPYWGDRKLDVSRATAERLGFKDRGVADLEVRVVNAPATEQDATYQKNRTYDRLPGYIGQYESLDAAQAGMAAAMVLTAMAPSMLAPVSGAAIAASRSGFPAPPEPAAAVAEAAPNAEQKPKVDATAPAATPPTLKVAEVVPASEPAASTQDALKAEAGDKIEVAMAAAPALAPAAVKKAEPKAAGLVSAAAEHAKPAVVPARKVRTASAKQSTARVARAARVVRNDRVRIAARTDVRDSPRPTARKAKPAEFASERPIVAKSRPAEKSDHPNDMSVFAQRSYAGLARSADASASARRADSRG